MGWLGVVVLLDYMLQKIRTAGREQYSRLKMNLLLPRLDRARTRRGMWPGAHSKVTDVDTPTMEVAAGGPNKMQSFVERGQRLVDRIQ